MHLTDEQLREFRNRSLKAWVDGHEIAHAERYMEALANDCGDFEVPSGVAEGSAHHLFLMAHEALTARTGSKKAKRSRAPEPALAKVKEEPKKPEPVKESAKVEAPASMELKDPFADTGKVVVDEVSHASPEEVKALETVKEEVKMAPKGPEKASDDPKKGKADDQKSSGKKDKKSDKY